MPKLARVIKRLDVDVVCALGDYPDVMKAYSQPLCYMVR